MDTAPTPASVEHADAAAQHVRSSAVASLDLIEDAGVGAREVVVPDLGSSVRWFEHGYPTPLARWHHHPEIEFHLIVASHGQMILGDQTRDFAPGQVVLVGPNLPHNWLSHLAPGESIARRDVGCQVLPEHVAQAARYLPELGVFGDLVEKSRRGIILVGHSAKAAAQVLASLGAERGLARLARLFALVDIFLNAPDTECEHVVSEGYVPSLDSETAHRVNTVLTYIEGSLDQELSMTRAADLVGLSPSAFSRFFHSTTGMTFSALVSRRRIARACHLLKSTQLPIGRVMGLSGYTSAVNFNRRFREHTGMTPSEYRKRS